MAYAPPGGFQGWVPTDFSVELRTPQGEVLPTVRQGDKSWVVGEPGQEFTVTVTANGPIFTDYRLLMKLDGQHPGYSLIMHHQNTRSCTFDGWLQGAAGGAGTTQTAYKAFKFGRSTPAEDAAVARNASEINVGTLEVFPSAVVASGQGSAPLNLKAAGPSSEAGRKKLPEGKKAFLAPTMKAEAGSLRTQATTWSLTEYATIAEEPTITLRYECSEALLMRRVLNPRNPAHRALLRKSANPGVRNAVPPEPQGGADGANSRRGGGAAAAAAAGVKRERDDEDDEHDEYGDDDEDDDGEFVPRSATAVKVDLTEEPERPLVVGGRAVRADELAVCDLAGSSDEEGGGPKWGIKKKQAIAL